MNQTEHKRKTFGPCPYCGNEFASVSVEAVVTGLDKNGFPAAFTYIATAKCCRCDHEFCVEGPDIKHLYERWDEMQKELKEYYGKPGSSEEDAERCPCCGGLSKVADCRPTPGAAGMFRVFCLECGVCTPAFSTKREALKTWNKRVQK